ncbi:hypothetical protein BJ508DRAFT_339309 [Ascobolus immersus RN42]|uniref:Uncharacterized protein n=1 Tax=Ascobolus immersus RN42 TaxID=1160509 RepID=A0A3N4HMK7_ASCIM|nr:hypothetical protein BJ508DRAFT_339309 [Ascobolus immersus RN42]
MSPPPHLAVPPPISLVISADFLTILTTLHDSLGNLKTTPDEKQQHPRPRPMALLRPTPLLPSPPPSSRGINSPLPRHDLPPNPDGNLPCHQSLGHHNPSLRPIPAQLGMDQRARPTLALEPHRPTQRHGPASRSQLDQPRMAPASTAYRNRGVLEEERDGKDIDVWFGGALECGDTESGPDGKDRAGGAGAGCGSEGTDGEAEELVVVGELCGAGTVDVGTRALDGPGFDTVQVERAEEGARRGRDAMLGTDSSLREVCCDAGGDGSDTPGTYHTPIDCTTLPGRPIAEDKLEGGYRPGEPQSGLNAEHSVCAIPVTNETQTSINEILSRLGNETSWTTDHDSVYTAYVTPFRGCQSIIKIVSRENQEDPSEPGDLVFKIGRSYMIMHGGRGYCFLLGVEGEEDKVADYLMEYVSMEDPDDYDWESRCSVVQPSLLWELSHEEQKL